ncbi:hypothetical protein Bca4012_103630 [Brassica carinata]
MGSPQADALSTQMPRHAVRRVLQTTIKAATPPRAAVVRQGPARRALTSLAPLSRELGPGPSLRTLLQTTPTPKTPDFQAGLFPSLAVTKGILLLDRTTDDITRLEFTTACRDAPGALSSDFGQPRAVTHGDQLPPHILERMGTTICDTQADVPRQKAWGATHALKDSMVHGFCNSTPSIDFATLFIGASRDIRCRVALDFTLQHYFQQTPPPVGESRLFSCMFLDTFRAGFGEIRKLCARSDRDLSKS